MPAAQASIPQPTCDAARIQQHGRAQKEDCAFRSRIFDTDWHYYFYLAPVHSLSATYKYFKRRPLSFIDGQAARLPAASWQSPRVNGKTSLRTGLFLARCRKRVRPYPAAQPYQIASPVGAVRCTSDSRQGEAHDQLTAAPPRHRAIHHRQAAVSRA